MAEPSAPPPAHAMATRGPYACRLALKLVGQALGPVCRQVVQCLIDHGVQQVRRWWSGGGKGQRGRGGTCCAYAWALLPPTLAPQRALPTVPIAAAAARPPAWRTVRRAAAHVAHGAGAAAPRAAGAAAAQLCGGAPQGGSAHAAGPGALLLPLFSGAAPHPAEPAVRRRGRRGRWGACGAGRQPRLLPPAARQHVQGEPQTCGVPAAHKTPQRAPLPDPHCRRARPGERAPRVPAGGARAAEVRCCCAACAAATAAAAPPQPEPCTARNTAPHARPSRSGADSPPLRAAARRRRPPPAGGTSCGRR